MFSSSDQSWRFYTESKNTTQTFYLFLLKFLHPPDDSTLRVWWKSAVWQEKLTTEEAMMKQNHQNNKNNLHLTVSTSTLFKMTYKNMKYHRILWSEASEPLLPKAPPTILQSSVWRRVSKWRKINKKLPKNNDVFTEVFMVFWSFWNLHFSHQTGVLCSVMSNEWSCLN